ncbi:MAG: hypothetical protein ACYCZN_09195 [Candidatus Dormibacteria bacterium]
MPQSSRRAIRVGLLSRDLMVLSRLASLARGSGFTMRSVLTEEGADGLDLLLVDLNADPEAQIERLGRLLVGQTGLRAVCFGPHLQLAGLRPRARAVGAERCVANSALLRLVEKMVKGAAPAPDIAGGRP